MREETDESFGTMLRGYRLAAQLTQEALAEVAGVSPRSLQALERGENKPQRDTVGRLANALRLGPEERQLFEFAAAPLPRQRHLAASLDTSVDHRGHNGTMGTTAIRPLSQPRDAIPHNLPLYLTSFVGRVEAMAVVARLLASTRLLTLTGTGGTGKTRLAVQAATALQEGYPQGVWFVELAPVSDPGLVALVVATTTGLREEAGQPIMETLAAALRSRRLLLILDNCEHLLDVCAELLDTLLHTCPDIQVLATSREAIGLAGEVAWRVPSLALPSPHQLPALEELTHIEAVHLFVERAQAVQPHFTLTAGNAASVVRVCQRLDGIPLAIELAAARVRALSVEQVAARLDQCFRLLTGGSRTALPRQQTLQATVDWSYSLLSAPEKTLFARTAVFVGGFTLDAAEVVCAGGNIATEDVLDLLTHLIDKSLVAVDDVTGDIVRYRLLQTLHQYGRERLVAGGEADDLYTRHAGYFRVVAEEADREIHEHQLEWLDLLDTEHDNLLQALEWAKEQGAAEEGLRLAVALGEYWWLSGRHSEGWHWVTTLLNLPEATERTAARAAALSLAAGLWGHSRKVMGTWLGATELVMPRRLNEEALAIAEEVGDQGILALILFRMGIIVDDLGDAAGATELLERALTLFRGVRWPYYVHFTMWLQARRALTKADRERPRALLTETLRLSRQESDLNGEARTVGCLSTVAWMDGDYEVARLLGEESLALWRRLGNRPYIAGILQHLGEMAYVQGQSARARRFIEERLALWQQVGERQGIANALCDLGRVAQQEREYAQAQTLLGECLTLQRTLGSRSGEADALIRLGDLARLQDNHARAATFYAEALELMRANGHQFITVPCLEGVAFIACTNSINQPERAAVLFGAAAALRHPLDNRSSWEERSVRDRQIAGVRISLGEDQFQVAWDMGQVMTLEQATAYAQDTVALLRETHLSAE